MSVWPLKRLTVFLREATPFSLTHQETNSGESRLPRFVGLWSVFDGARARLDEVAIGEAVCQYAQSVRRARCLAGRGIHEKRWHDALATSEGVLGACCVEFIQLDSAAGPGFRKDDLDRFDLSIAHDYGHRINCDRAS
jgi:hypothetical protein